MPKDQQHTPSTGSRPAPDASASDALNDYARQLSEMIHDLRTPLTSIIGAASSIRDYGARFSDETRARLCDDIMEQAEHLAQMLNGMTIIARARSGALTPRRDAVDLAELIGDVLQKAQAQHGAARVRSAAAPPPILLSSDRQLLETAVLCLVEATTHHTADDGAIELLASQADGTAWISVAVGVRPTSRAAVAGLVESLTSPTPPQPLTMALVSLAAAREAIHSLDGKLTAALDEPKACLSLSVGLPL